MSLHKEDIEKSITIFKEDIVFPVKRKDWKEF